MTVNPNQNIGAAPNNRTGGARLDIPVPDHPLHNPTVFHASEKRIPLIPVLRNPETVKIGPILPQNLPRLAQPRALGIIQIGPSDIRNIAINHILRHRRGTPQKRKHHGSQKSKAFHHPLHHICAPILEAPPPPCQAQPPKRTNTYRGLSKANPMFPRPNTPFRQRSPKRRSSISATRNIKHHFMQATQVQAPKSVLLCPPLTVIQRPQRSAGFNQDLVKNNHVDQTRLSIGSLSAKYSISNPPDLNIVGPKPHHEARISISVISTRRVKLMRSFSTIFPSSARNVFEFPERGSDG